MKYRENTTYDLMGLSVHEMSVIQAGLQLLAANGRSPAIGGYPEYREPAQDLLGIVNPDACRKLLERLSQHQASIDADDALAVDIRSRLPLATHDGQWVTIERQTFEYRGGEWRKVGECRDRGCAKRHTGSGGCIFTGKGCEHCVNGVHTFMEGCALV